MSNETKGSTPTSPSTPSIPTTPTKPLIPAAMYVRMSTEHQQYSTENQADAIRAYAEKSGFEIVETFEDAGKSGLNIAGRESLRRLIAKVESGNSP